MTLLTSPAVALLLRTTLLLGLALLAVRLLRPRGPAAQSLAGRTALAAVALLLLTAPLTKFVPPLWHVPAPAAPRPAAPAPVLTLTPSAPPPQFWGAGIGTEKGAGASPAPTDAQPPTPTIAATPPAPVRNPTPPELGAGGPLLLVLWATGTALLLLWLAACQWHLTRLHRRAVLLANGPAYDTLAALTPHAPRLYACPDIDGPFLAGIVRPAIYLPADHAETFSSDALRAVLAHELAHAERHDTRWTLASRLLCALLWPQPLLWLLCRRLEQLSEDACDRAVLAHACPPRVYADCLLTLAERRPLSRPQRALVQGLVPFRSQLAHRIQHILAATGDLPMLTVTPRLRLAIATAAVLAALGGTLLIAAPAQITPLAVSAPTLIGVWSATYAPNSSNPQVPQVSTLVFGPHGDIVSLEQQGLVRQYFRYTVKGSVISATLIRTEVKEGGVLSGSSVVFSGTSRVPALPYSIVDGVLTLRRQTAPPTVAKRIADYPAGLPIETVVEKQAELMAAKPPMPALISPGEAQLLAGLTPVQGPGIIVTLSDSKKPAPPFPKGFQPPNLIHDTDISAVVNELKASGAEAISVNGQRFVATTAIRNVGPTVMINDTPQAAPFVIKAIGDSKTLSEGIERPDGVIKQLKIYDPAMVSIQTTDTLALPAYSGKITPRYAKPEAQTAGSGHPISANPPQARTFTVNFRVPRQGVHHFQVFVRDETGQRLLFDKIGKPGTNITIPATATGRSAAFRIYDNGKLVTNPSKASTGIKRRTAMNGVRDALLTRRNRLVTQLNITNLDRDTLKVKLEAMHQQFQKRRAGFKPPQLPVARTTDTDQNYPLRKQQFIVAVHNYNSLWIKSYNQEAEAKGAMRRSLAKYENKQRHLQKEIADLNAQVENVEVRMMRG